MSDSFLRKTTIMGVLGLAVAACSPNAVSPPPPMMTLTQFDSRDLHNAALLTFLRDTGTVQGDSFPKRWGFRQLYAAALFYNPAMDEVRAQIKAAKAAEQTAGESPNPSITLSPSRDSTVTPLEWLFGVGLSIPIETAGKLERRVDLANAQTRSAESQLESKAWDIRSAVLVAFLDVEIAAENVKRITLLEKTQSQIATEYSERMAQGQLPTAIASQAQISYQQSHLLLEQSKTDQGQALARLVGAIGVPLAALQGITLDPAFPQMDEKLLADKELRRKAITQHPLLATALADYKVTHEALRLELAKQVPDINIGPGYEWNKTAGGSKISLGLSIVLPILNNNEGAIAEAEAKRLQAARHFDTLQATVINNIEQAEALRSSSKRELAAAHHIVTLQRTKQSRLETMIQQNQAGTLPLLYGQSEVQTAEVSELSVKAKLLKASAQLEDALRLPLFAPTIAEKK